MEKLFVQIFERKKWIIEEVRHQTQLFDQHLASTLLIDGITPPPWLLQPSHPSEFKKEELISELLSPHAQAPNPYSVYNCSMYGNTRSDLRELQDGSKGRLFTRDIGKDKLSYMSEFPVVGNESVQNGVSEIDPTVMSPQDQKELTMPDTYYDLDESLARLQRSRARQKAFELRNSGRSSSSSLHNSKGAEVQRSRISGCEIHAPPANQILNEESIHPHKSSCSTSGAVHGRANKKEDNSHSGRVTRSMTSRSQPLHVDKSAKSGISSSIVEGGNGESLEVSRTGNLCIGCNLKQRSVEEVRKYSRRQLKSRNSKFFDKVTRTQNSPSDTCVDESLKLEGFDTVARESYISKSIQQDTCIERPMEMNGSYGMNKGDAGASESNEVESVPGSDGLVKTRYSLCQLDADSPSTLDNMDACDGRIAKHDGTLLQLPQVENSFGCVAEPHDSANKFACPNIQARFDAVEKTCKTSSAAHDIEKGSGLKRSVPSKCIDNADQVSLAVIAGGFVNPAKDAPAKISSGLYDANCNQVSLAVIAGGFVNPAKDAPEKIPSGLYDANCNVESDKVHCTSIFKMLKPKQLDFDEKGGCQTIANEVDSTLLEDRTLEEVPNEDPINFLKAVDGGAEEKSEELYDANCKNNSEGLELGSDCEVLKQKQFEFDDKGECSNIVNEVTSIMLDGRSMKEVPREGTVSSLKEPYREDRGNSSDICFEDCADHLYGGSIIPSQVPLLSESEPVQVNIDGPNCSLGGRRTSSFENRNRDSDAAKLCSLDSSKTAISYDFPIVHSVDGNTADGNLDGQESDQNGGLTLEDTTSEEKQDTADSNVSGSPIDLMQGNGSCLKGFEPFVMHQTEEDTKVPDTTSHGSEILDSKSGAHRVSSKSTLLRQSTAKSQCPLADEAEIVGLSSIDRERESPDEKEHQLPTQDKLEITRTEGLTSFGKSLGDIALCVGANLGFSYQTVGTPNRQSLELSSAAEMMPVFEGFTVQTVDEQPSISMDECSFEKFDVQDFTMERASIVEQLCQSACLHAPLSPLSAADKLKKVSNMYHSVPNGLLENISFMSTLLTDDGTSEAPRANSVNEVGQGSVRWSSSDPLPLSGVQSDGYQYKPYMSPVGKLWDIISSSSGSSKEKGSLHSELPCISEESESVYEVADAPAEDICSDTMTRSLKRTPLAEIKEDSNCLSSVSETQDQTIAERYSIDSVNTEFSFNGTNRRIKQKTSKDENHRGHDSKIRDSKPVRRVVSAVDRPMESLQSRLSKAKTNLRRDGPNISGKDSKQGNIVSNVTSFLPLVQQKPTVVPLAGKRDVKVKALEAAEAAKRQAAKREIERQMKKEALKLERARAEKENLRQQELQKRKKEEERKKREADLAKKRQREEEERKEKERKRRRLEEARKHRTERAKMEEKETNYNGMQESKNEVAKQKKMVESVKTEKTTCATAGMSKGLENTCQNLLTSPETCQTPINIGDTAKVTSIVHEALEKKQFVSGGTVEKSYEISPYQCSDDEDEEEEEDVPNNKFIPSWACKSHIAMVIRSQDNMDPEAIFPSDSFCSISEVVLPRRFQQR